MNNDLLLYALEKGLLAAHRLRAVRLESDDAKRNPFVYIGSFNCNGNTYAFMVNEDGEGTYRCQAAADYANEAFNCKTDYSGTFPILRLIKPEED